MNGVENAERGASWARAAGLFPTGARAPRCSRGHTLPRRRVQEVGAASRCCGAVCAGRPGARRSDRRRPAVRPSSSRVRTGSAHLAPDDEADASADEVTGEHADDDLAREVPARRHPGPRHATDWDEQDGGAPMFQDFTGGVRRGGTRRRHGSRGKPGTGSWQRRHSPPNERLQGGREDLSRAMQPNRPIRSSDTGRTTRTAVTRHQPAPIATQTTGDA